MLKKIIHFFRGKPAEESPKPQDQPSRNSGQHKKKKKNSSPARQQQKKESTGNEGKSAVEQKTQRPTNKKPNSRKNGKKPDKPKAAPLPLPDPDTPRRLELPPFDESWVPQETATDSTDSVRFRDLNLHPRLLKSLLEEMKFTACTPIQGLALPHTLAGKDLAGRAQTGTGKTAAFLLTIFNKMLEEDPERLPNQPYALAIAPTRELAIQIEKDAAEIGCFTGLRTLAVYGGMNYDKQRDDIVRGVDLVAATPGRLLDYCRQHVIDLSKVRVMVIDEADRMLDMGFIPDVRKILAHLGQPSTRQTLLFSATLDHKILDLAKTWMRPNPTIVEAEPEHVVADGIEEIVYAISSKEKFAVLHWILKNETCERVLIFRNQRRDVEKLHQQLHRYGIHSEMLSGDVPQKKRLHILEAFRSGDAPIIVATDVAGRGIHVDGISHVVNYDFPFEAEDYVHRIGRTGRAGAKGRAISFAGEDCAFVIPEIEEYIDRPLPTCQPQTEMLELPPAPKGVHGEIDKPRRNSGGGGGRRRRPQQHGGRSGGQRGGNRRRR